MQRGSLIGLGFIALYLTGLAFPQALWGLDSLAWLPLPFQILLPILAVAAILLGEWRARRPEKKVSPGKERGKPKLGWVWLIGLAVAPLFYFNPIAAPVYGDAAKFDQLFSRADAETAVTTDPSLILSPNVFHPKVGERTVLNAIKVLPVDDHKVAFRLWGAFMGFCFVMVWLTAIFRHITSPPMRLILALSGLSSTCLLIFCGHIEIYAAASIFVLGFMLNLLDHLRKPGWSTGFLMGLALFWALKFHSSAFLLVPAFALALCYGYARNRPHLLKYFTWKWGSTFLLLPVFVGGAVVYFFVLQDHADPRFLNPDISVYERLFLPLQSPAAPLDRYNLLSGYHLFDYVNIILMWSLGSLFVLFTLLLTQRRQLRPQEPGFIIVGLTLLLYLAFFFMVNPLLSMPIDWDLFTLPAPVLLVFVFLLASQVDQEKLARQTFGGVLALSLLGLSFFWVNTHRDSLGQRLESIGQHAYRSYWIRSARVMTQGWALQALPPAAENARRESVLAELEPYAVPGDDIEYAFLLTETGKYYRSTLRDPAAALPWHLKAARYAPQFKANLIGLLECYFFARDWDKAYPVAQDLIAIQYPSRKQSLAIGVQIALEAEKYIAAAQHCEAYLALAPGDAVFAEIFARLRANERVGELKMLFNQQ